MKISYLGVFIECLFELVYLLMMNYHIHNNSHVTTSILIIFTLIHILGIYLVVVINLKKQFANCVRDANVSDKEQNQSIVKEVKNNE